MKRLIMIAALVLAISLTGNAQEKKFPKLDDGQVIMNWSDFEKILKELLKPPPEVPEEEEEEEPEPPMDYSFRSASFRVEIGEGFARVEADYALDVLRDKQWIVIPLGRNTSGVHKALVDGKPALIGGRGNEISVFLLGKAAHRLQVTYTVAAPHNPGPNSFNVYVASVPGAMITLTAPSELSEITISGAVKTESIKKDGAQTIQAITGATSNIGVNYTVPVPEALAVAEEKIPAKLYSTVELLVSIADEVVTAKANFNYDIKHSPMSRFSIDVPDGYDVVNVTGQGLSGWKADEGTLNVNVNYEVKGPYNLQVHMESKREMASGAVKIPEPITKDTERESGFVAVETKSSLEVNIVSLEGLVPIDAQELPSGLRYRAKYPILYSFRFGRHVYSGDLSVTRHEEVSVLTAAIDIINLVTLLTDDGKSVTRMIFEVRNNKKQYLKVDLPEKAEVWSAYLDDDPIKPSKNEKGQILVPLKKSGAGDEKVSFTAELIYYAPIDEMEKSGEIKIAFPKADIPASEMYVSLYLPPKFKYKKFEGDLEDITDKPEDISETFAYAPQAVGGARDEDKKIMKAKKERRYSKRALTRQAQMETEIADELQMRQAVVPQMKPGSGGQAPASAKPRSRGMLPVKFNVPLRGSVHRFSKLLVMDEAPELTFNYKKTRKPIPWHYVWTTAKIFLLLLVIVAFIYLIKFLRSRSLRNKQIAAQAQAAAPRPATREEQEKETEIPPPLD